MTRWLAAAALIALAGCGKVQELRPAPGKAMPVKPATEPRAATVEELMAPPPQSRPRRIDDVVEQSEKRKPDPFDLPPPG